MMRHYHKHAKVIIGEAGVTIQQSSGTIDHANIIYADRNEAGEIITAMLDRKIHDEYTGYGDWEMSGCFATEMRSLVVAKAEPEEQEGEDWFIDQVTLVLGDEYSSEVVAAIAGHIQAESEVVDLWTRVALLDELRGWIVQRLDDAVPDADLEQLDQQAERVIGRFVGLLS